MIERLVIHRFRGIRQGELADLGKFNLLIGPNNNGSSLWCGPKMGGKRSKFNRLAG